VPNAVSVDQQVTVPKAIRDSFDQGVLPAAQRTGKLRPGLAGVTTQVGIAMRGERKVIDKIVDGLKFHS
jgi:hypothetical protein